MEGILPGFRGKAIIRSEKVHDPERRTRKKVINIKCGEEDELG
jgi:hypothetical protein